jgi:hypothetical protein
VKKAPSSSASFSPLLFVVAAAVLWSTGGLFLKWTSLSGLELSFGRSLLAASPLRFSPGAKALD